MSDRIPDFARYTGLFAKAEASATELGEPDWAAYTSLTIEQRRRLAAPIMKLGRKLPEPACAAADPPAKTIWLRTDPNFKLLSTRLDRFPTEDAAGPVLEGGIAPPGGTVSLGAEGASVARERAFLQAEVGTLRSLIEESDRGDVIGRFSLQCRLEQVEAELAQLERSALDFGDGVDTEPRAMEAAWEQVAER